MPLSCDFQERQAKSPKQETSPLPDSNLHGTQGLLFLYVSDFLSRESSFGTPFLAFSLVLPKNFISHLLFPYKLLKRII